MHQISAVALSGLPAAGCARMAVTLLTEISVTLGVTSFVALGLATLFIKSSPIVILRNAAQLLTDPGRLSSRRFG